MFWYPSCLCLHIIIKKKTTRKSIFWNLIKYIFQSKTKSREKLGPFSRQTAGREVRALTWSYFRHAGKRWGCRRCRSAVVWWSLCKTGMSASSTFLQLVQELCDTDLCSFWRGKKRRKSYLSSLICTVGALQICEL